MKKSLYFFSLLILFTSSSIFAQSKKQTTEKEKITISGKVTDQASGAPILFCTVALFKNNILLQGTESDLDGNYHFMVDSTGIYDIGISYVGYQAHKITGINVTGNTITDIFISEGVTLQTATIVEYKAPLVNFDNTTSGGIVTADKIRSLPTTNSSALAARVAGISIRGSRTNGSHHYVDGVRVRRNKKNKQSNLQSEIVYNNEPTTEDYSRIIENKFISPKDEALSTFSIDVDRASYSNVRRFINQHQMPPVDAVRIEEMINYFPYEYTGPTDDVPFSIEHNLTSCPWNPKNQILHIGIQSERIEEEKLPPSNIVFLIDVSGSMSSSNKLGLVKSSLTLLVDKMREEDKIAIVVYAGSAGLVLESTYGSNKKEIKKALRKLTAGGSTAGGAGINLAYSVAKENFIANGNNRVIIATDGDFNVGVSSDGGLVRLIEEKREEDIFLSVLGYGMGNYKDNKMQQLADSGNGNHAYIDNIEEAKKTLLHEFAGTLFTIAKDVKIQIEFNPEFVKSYKLIGYENRMLDKQDFNDDKKDAGELGAGHSVTAFYEIVPQSKKRRVKPEVDELKYQASSSLENKTDFATIKLRYKKPKGTKSKKIEAVISPVLKTEISDDVAFALCVAEFGMMLRNSKDVKNSTYVELLEKTKETVNLDEENYREDFISMVENVIRIED